MVFDACDGLLFTTGTGITNVTADRTGARISQTAYTDALDLRGGGTGLTEPMHLLVRYANAANASGSNVLQFNAQISADGTTWFDRTSGDPNKITLTTTAQKGVLTLPILTEDRYIRVAVTINGSGTTPIVDVLSVDLNISRKN